MKKTKTLYHQSSRLQFSVGQTVALAAGAASIAAISTALLASHWFSIRLGNEAFLQGTTGSSTYVSRTVIASNRVPQDWGDAESLWKPPAEPSPGPRSALRKEPKQQDDTEYKMFSKNGDDLDGNDGSIAKVAWLMSFPNSGTSFTLHLTREASNCTTATNYALEGEIKDQPGVPVVPGEENGPWLQLIPNRLTSIPRYILTKTHCGGFCSYCPPDRYIETPRSFKIACQSGTKAYETGFGEIKKSPVTYDSKLVKRAIRLVRSPLDNIVARFHLDRRRQMRGNLGNKTAWPELFPNNNTGFQRWCEFLDSNAEEELLSLHWIDEKLREAMKGVPCQLEFYRYVQWHNLADTTIKDMRIPSLTIHYNDYRDNLEGTLDSILHFLKLPKSTGRVPFEDGKEYDNYYSVPQKKAIYTFLKEFSTRSTWNELKKYKIVPHKH